MKTVRQASMKKRKSFSYTITTKKLVFVWAESTTQISLLVICNLTLVKKRQEKP
jgi:hypothetical protein